MTVAILDSTVIIHIFRKNRLALNWFAAQQIIYSITPITWMEVMLGVPNKRAQEETLELLNSFEMLHLTSADQNWAMWQMQNLRFSQGVGVMDCFNASVCYRLNVPIYSDNQKDFLKLLPAELVVKPY